MFGIFYFWFMDVSKLFEIVSSFVNVEPAEMSMFMERMEIIHMKKNAIWDSKNKIGTKMGFINKGILRQYYEKEEVMMLVKDVLVGFTL